MDKLIESIRSCPLQDSLQIIKLGKRLAKIAVNEEFSDIKISVLGSGSIQFIVLALRALLLKYDIKADIYEGEYDGIGMDILDGESSFYCFCPHVAILLPDYKDIRSFPAVMSGWDEVLGWAKEQAEVYKQYWDLLQERLPGIHIFQGNFVIPVERELGNLEGNLPFSRNTCFQLLNLELLQCKPNNVTILDMEYTASYIGKKAWFDPAAWFWHKASFSVDYIGAVAGLIAGQIAAFYGKIRKCLVLDLDNTLWGGVVGDDGCNGINLDPNDAAGEAYLAFQRYLLRLKERGIILAVCSKNDLETAKEPFEKNPNMLLRLGDFAAFRANWENKAENIVGIAGELNIGLDAMVFFDDNPAEREIVRQNLPDVWVVDVPEDPADYVMRLNGENPFEWMQITAEDKERTETYHQNKKRKEMQESFRDYGEYLKALCMKGSAGLVCGGDSGRFVQLINKSNQFNLRTVRYSEGQIEEYLHNPNVACLKIELEDKFSRYGVISCIILKKEGDDCFIDTWVMSCRVLKRGVEDFAFKNILEIARKWGCKKIRGEYIPTKKNKMVENLYEGFGFSAVCTREPSVIGQSVYEYDVDKEYTKKIYIEEEGD
ncbi:MAG: HAD-IIIC family phosphatase [Lachnospiraceae bacterium]|nr:HAD-IIIC family phosphatase [Lachnospiraceae bacterium]